jgi:hypothetical protein
MQLCHFAPYSPIVETKREVSMNVVWLIVGVGIVGFLAKWIVWSGTRGSQSDLGFVSQQWLAEHRLSQISDPQR